jgi:hypothetical protein
MHFNPLSWEESVRATKPSLTKGEAVSNVRGRFRPSIWRSVSRLSFTAKGPPCSWPGPHLHSQEVAAFAGALLLDASLAEMTTGFKSIAACLAQPFIRRRGGGIPIHISGTRSNPSFGVQIKKALLSA